MRRRGFFAVAKWLESHVEDVKYMQQMCRGGIIPLLWALFLAKESGRETACRLKTIATLFPKPCAVSGSCLPLRNKCWAWSSLEVGLCFLQKHLLFEDL